MNSCISGPYIITNKLLLHNAAEREPLCPAELLELWSFFFKKWQIVVVQHPFTTYHLDVNNSHLALFCCLCSLDLAEDEFIQIFPHNFHLGVKLMVLQEAFFAFLWFHFLAFVLWFPHQFNKTIHFHFILANKLWKRTSKICFNFSQWLEFVKVLSFSVCPQPPQPSLAPLLRFLPCWLFDTFADMVVCVGSVADYTVSVYSFASGICPWLFLTQNVFIFQTLNALQKFSGSGNCGKNDLSNNYIWRVKCNKQINKMLKQKCEGMVSSHFLRQFFIS